MTSRTNLIDITALDDSALDALLGVGPDGEGWLTRNDLNEAAALVVVGRGVENATYPSMRSAAALRQLKSRGELFTAQGEITELGESVRSALIAQKPDWAVQIGAAT
jgi:hypothetical protein